MRRTAKDKVAGVRWSRCICGQLWGKSLPGVIGVKRVADFSSKTVQDGKSLNPRGRSGVLVPWDMPKPQGGESNRAVKRADQRASSVFKGTESTQLWTNSSVRKATWAIKTLGAPQPKTGVGFLSFVMLLLFSARARDDIGFFGDQTGRVTVGN